MKIKRIQTIVLVFLMLSMAACKETIYVEESEIEDSESTDEEEIVAILLNGESVYSRPVLERDTKLQSDIVSHKNGRSHRRANSWKRVWSYFDRKTKKNERTTDNC